MSLNNAYADLGTIGVAATSNNQFIICQSGGGYQGLSDPDGLVYYNWIVGQEVVNDMLAGGDLTSAPSITNNGSYVAARGTDGNIWFLDEFSKWSSLPDGSLVTAPSICLEQNHTIHVFAVGLDNQLWHTFKLKNQNWIPWSSGEEKIPKLNVGIKSAPSVVSPKAGRFDIVVQGNDNHIYHLSWDGESGGWFPWEDLNGQATAVPTCCWWGYETFHVFARGTDGQIWHKYYDWSSRKWHNPHNPADNLGWGNDVPAHPNGMISSAPVAVVDLEGRVDIFAKAFGAEVWNVRWNGTNWESWKPIFINSVSYPA